MGTLSVVPRGCHNHLEAEGFLGAYQMPGRGTQQLYVERMSTAGWRQSLVIPSTELMHTRGEHHPFVLNKICSRLEAALNPRIDQEPQDSII